MHTLSRIPAGYTALAALVAWGAALLLLNLLRQGGIGIEEGAAKDLLLLWSIADRVASPVGTFGTPDFRAFLFIPPAIYWPGSVMAAKIFTAMLTFGAIYLLFKWSRSDNNESALIAAALLLICPLTITQIDTLGAGPFLVLCAGLAYWVDIRYRERGRHLGGWFFIQLLIVALAVSVHPMGLAYPFALIYIWAIRQCEQSKERKKSIFIGTAITVALIIAFRMGWQDDLAWLNNPLQTLANAFQNGYSQLAEPGNQAVGIIALIVVCLVIFYDRKFLLNDLTGCTLLFGLILGLIAADAAWALFAVTLLLFRGLHLLIAVNDSFKSDSLLGKRGLVIAISFATATGFMMIDKRYTQELASEMYAPNDELIRTLCDSVNAFDEETPFKAASQWPAKTMIACRRDTFPLPSAEEDGSLLLEKIQGITHLIFNHNNEDNRPLAQNIAEAPSQTKTLAIQPGGVIIHISRESNGASGINSPHTVEPSKQTNPATTLDSDQ